MNNRNKKIVSNIPFDDNELIDVITSSYLSLEDVNWLKSKWWFKRFLKIYVRELKKRYKGKEKLPISDKNKVTSKPKKEIVEVLDFTRELKLPEKEVVEILDFTKTIDITDLKDITRATDNAKKKVKKEKVFWTSVIVVCSVILVGLCLIIVNWMLENKKTEKILKKIDDVVEINDVATTTQKEEISEEEESLYSKYGSMNMMNVSFNELLKVNSDTKGWIRVNGTEVNYPFVQSKDNEFYLKHSFDKSYNKKGWAFLDYRNDIDNLQKNSILYAHGLVNNQMFGSLRRVIKPNWYNNKENYIIRVSTLKSNQLWEVFSTYTIEPESYYITTSFSSDNEFITFINTIKSRSVHDFNVSVSKDDKILTLSSCYDNTKRMVLHAKLVSYQNK